MNQDYAVELTENGAALRGVLRLHSADAYDDVFVEVRQAIERNPVKYSLDVSRVVFLNSSGIRGLAGLIIAARDRNIAILVIGSAASAWQVKTLPAFKSLHPELEVRLQ